MRTNSAVFVVFLILFANIHNVYLKTNLNNREYNSFFIKNKHSHKHHNNNNNNNATSTNNNGLPIEEETEIEKRANFMKLKSKLQATKANSDSSEIWVKCADEGEECIIPGPERFVRYGNSVYNEFKVVTASNSIICNSKSFGEDPSEFNSKSCSYLNASTEFKKCSVGGGYCKLKGNRIVRLTLTNRKKEKEFFYRFATNTILCDNASFNAPNYSAKYRTRKVGDYYTQVTLDTESTCDIVEPSYWAYCSEFGGDCNFTGKSLVRYGLNENYSYTEVYQNVACKKGEKHFSTAIDNSDFICSRRLGAYFWVDCATEGQKCSFTGKLVARFGYEGNFVYKEATNSIDCTSAAFGKTINSDKDLSCSIVVYNTAPEPEAVQKLKATLVEAEQLTIDEAEDESSCDSDSGFGFNGGCFSDGFKDRTSSAPGSVQSAVYFLFHILTSIAFPFDFCAGDFPGTSLGSNPSLARNKCSTLPLMGDYKYGVIGVAVDNVPCGATPVSITACIAFDRCGTVALSTNAGLLQCAATYSTGLAAILSPVSDVLDYANIGFSLKRRFTQSFTIAYRDGTSVATKSITTYGHFMAKIGFALPLNDFKIAGKAIKDFFSFNVEATYTLDFGNVSSVVESMIDNMISTKSSNRSNVLDTLLNSGAETALTVTGYFVLNFNAITKGFLPDIAFSLDTTNFLLTLGGGASGMARGFYFYKGSGVLNLGAVLNLVVNQFKPLFGALGVILPDLSNLDLSLSYSLGLFLNDDAAGFQIDILGFNLKCVFAFNSGSGSCDLDSKIFTAIIEGAKWVIRHARQLLDATGKKIVEFANDVGNFAENAAESVGEFFSNDVRNFFERDVAGAFVSAANDAKDFFENEVGDFVDNIGDTAVDVAEDIKDTVENVANDIKDTVEDVAEDVKDVFEDVKDAVVNTVNNAANTLSNAASTVINSEPVQKIANFFKSW